MMKSLLVLALCSCFVAYTQAACDSVAPSVDRYNGACKTTSGVITDGCACSNVCVEIFDGTITDGTLVDDSTAALDTALTLTTGSGACRCSNGVSGQNGCVTLSDCCVIDLYTASCTNGICVYSGASSIGISFFQVAVLAASFLYITL